MFSNPIQTAIMWATAIVLIAFGAGIAVCYYLNHKNKPKNESED
jgi:hypothetical protein